MENWNFKLKNTPATISKNLESSFRSVNGFVVNIKNNKSNPISFNIRKRIQYAWYLYYINSVIVNGRLSKTSTQNETSVEISFHQHFLWKAVVYSNLLLGAGFIIAIISGNNAGTAMYLLAAVTLAIGSFLWFRLQKKYERNVHEYKILISEILEV